MDHNDALEVGKGEVMTIRLYTGTPGAGKSLHMAQILYWQLKAGRVVVANFDINREMFDDDELSRFYFLDGDHLDPHRLAEIARDHVSGRVIEGEVKLFVDECQLVFNAREWNDSRRKDWVKFFTQHRKLSYDVYLVTQFGEMLDKQIRALVEYEVMHRKLNMVGWVGKLVDLLFFRHPVVVAVTYWAPVRQRLSGEWMLGTRKFYNLYDSYHIFDGASL